MKQYQKKLDQLYTEFSSGENGLSTEQAVKNCEKFGGQEKVHSRDLFRAV